MEESKNYRLKENPFDIFSHRHEMANRREEWEWIENSLKSAFKGRSPRYFLILGDYGEGKSYLLDKIYYFLSVESKETEDVFIVRMRSEVFFEKPLAIMQSEPRWSKFGLNFVTRIFDNIERDKLIEVLNKADLSDFKSANLKVFEGLRNNEETAFRFVIGDKLTAAERKDLGVPTALIDSPTGLSLLFDFLRIINLSGYNNMLLLLDELEYITAVLSDTKITQILNTFREIFDTFGYYSDRYLDQIAKPIFIFAVSPGGWDKLKELEESARKKTGGGGIAPFMERISERDKIHLKAFKLEDTRELVKLRLSEARTKKVEDPLFPFTDKCVEFIHKISFNKPRNVIQYCGIVLEDAIEEGLEKIELKDAKRILQKYGIYTEK